MFCVSHKKLVDRISCVWGFLICLLLISYLTLASYMKDTPFLDTIFVLKTSIKLVGLQVFLLK